MCSRSSLTPCEGLRPCFDGEPALFTVEMSRYRKYGELLRNAGEGYPLRDGSVPEMEDTARVGQAAADPDAAKFHPRQSWWLWSWFCQCLRQRGSVGGLGVFNG